MQYRRLGRTGLKVSEVCLGTMTFGQADWGNDEAQSDAIFNVALDAGINFYDTANSYAAGQSETIFGRIIKGKRDKLIVATKVFNPMGTVHWNGDRDEVEDFENTVRSLMGSGDCEGSEDLIEKCFGGLIMRNSTLEPVDVNADLAALNRGLGPRLNHLADYVYSVSDFVRNPNLDRRGRPIARAAKRGRELFNDPVVGCAGCHRGPSASNQQFTDKALENPLFDPGQAADSRNNPFLRHDVGTANLFDETDPMVVAVAEDVFHNRPNVADPDDVIMPSSRAPLRAYLSPTLVDVWLTAPFLHDGSALTLHDVVRSCNSAEEECCNPKLEECTGKNTGRNIDDQHGVTSHLNSLQLDDLVAFLSAPHGPVSETVAAGAPAATLPPSIPPELPEPPEFPDTGPPPLPVGEPGSFAIQSLPPPLGRFPTGFTLDLLSVGFTLSVEALGVSRQIFVIASALNVAPATHCWFEAFWSTIETSVGSRVPQRGRRRASWQRTTPSASARWARGCGRAPTAVRTGYACVTLSPWRVGCGRWRSTPPTPPRSLPGPTAACIAAGTTA